jgi:hypothetical protein
MFGKLVIKDKVEDEINSQLINHPKIDNDQDTVINYLTNLNNQIQNLAVRGLSSNGIKNWGKAKLVSSNKFYI